MKTLVICSGGLDSVSLSYKIAAEQQLMGLISFDYGQRHVKELQYAAICADALGVHHQIIDIRSIGVSLTGSALTDDIAVPDGHYNKNTMKLTIVPNRNAILLTIAFGIASAQKADAVSLAVHGGDHFIYPDCRPDFINSFQLMQNHALDGCGKIQLLAPYINHSKSDIVTDGARYHTPFEATWSCYKGEATHCGRCGTCLERREAFHLANINDPTIYTDTDFWREACGKGDAGCTA